jgi:hypothetical protein
VKVESETCNKVKPRMTASVSFPVDEGKTNCWEPGSPRLSDPFSIPLRMATIPCSLSTRPKRVVPPEQHIKDPHSILHTGSGRVFFRLSGSVPMLDWFQESKQIEKVDQAHSPVSEAG